MRHIFKGVAALLFAVVSVNASAQKYYGGVIDKTVAVVGNEVIMISDLESEMQMMQSYYGMQSDRKARCELLENMLRHHAGGRRRTSGRSGSADLPHDRHPHRGGKIPHRQRCRWHRPRHRKRQRHERSAVLPYPVNDTRFTGGRDFVFAKSFEDLLCRKRSAFSIGIFCPSRVAVKTTQAVALTVLGPANLRFFGFSLFRFRS